MIFRIIFDMRQLIKNITILLLHCFDLGVLSVCINLSNEQDIIMTKPLLVVDDDRDLEEPICELAEDMGFEVKFKTSAKKFQETYLATIH
jgi:hypothetical protein